VSWIIIDKSKPRTDGIGDGSFVVVGVLMPDLPIGYFEIIPENLTEDNGIAEISRA